MRAAEAVACSFSQFVDGLKAIGDEIRMRLHMAEEELAQQEKGE